MIRRSRTPAGGDGQVTVLAGSEMDAAGAMAGDVAMAGVVAGGGAVATAGIVISGGNYGIASTGANATLIQVQIAGGAAVIGDVPDLQPREIPVLATLAEADPVGRDAIISQAGAELAAGTSVQLHGAPGTGRKAIARALIRRLGLCGIRGIELRPDGEPLTLPAVYQRLTAAFFGVTTWNPAEEILRPAAAGLDALIVVTDCDLEPGHVTRLLATFPRCVFLLTSQHPTIGRAGTAHEIDPLPRDAAFELITQEIGDNIGGLQNLQLDQAYRLSGGQTQRLLQYAAFLKSTAGRPGHLPHTSLTPASIASILAAALSEPARRVLVALATFSADLAPDCFAAVTGLPENPAAGPALSQAGHELLTARLVTESTAGYRIAPDATYAVQAAGWEPANPVLAAQGLLPHLTTHPNGLTAQPGAIARPGADLLLAIARALAATGQDAQASQFIRAAAPAALAAGNLRAWTHLLALGIPAATASRKTPDLQYFLQEQHTRSLLQGDTIAAAAVLATLIALHDTAPPPTAPVSHPHKITRHLIRHSRKALSTSHGAVTVGAAIVTVAAVTATVIIATKPGNSAAPSARPATVAWTTAFQTSPTTPLTGPVTSYTFRAQYPVITSSALILAREKDIDTLMQQPIVNYADYAAKGARADASLTPAGSNIGTDTTAVTRAGLVLSIKYYWVSADNTGGNNGQILVLRMDSGAVVPPSGILTNLARTHAGAVRITNILNNTLSKAYISYCRKLPVSEIGTGLTSSNPANSLVQIGVAASGIEFWVGPGAQNCNLAVIVVPFRELSGLVKPSIIALAAGRT